MPKETRLRIRNWKKHQHYSYRKPPWIKLYRDILDDAEWHKLSGESAKGLIMLWLIASEDEGYLPDSATLAFRLRISENRASALLSDCSHWLENHASKMLARRYQDATPEKETERELEKENYKTEAPAVPEVVPVGVWLAFAEMRKRIRHPLTDYAGELIRRKLQTFKSEGYDPVEILETSIANGWRDVFQPKEKSNGESFEERRQRKSAEAIRATGDRAREILREVDATPRLESGKPEANRHIRRGVN